MKTSNSVSPAVSSCVSFSRIARPQGLRQQFGLKSWQSRNCICDYHVSILFHVCFSVQFPVKHPFTYIYIYDMYTNFGKVLGVKRTCLLEPSHQRVSFASKLPTARAWNAHRTLPTNLLPHAKIWTKAVTVKPHICCILLTSHSTNMFI